MNSKRMIYEFDKDGLKSHVVDTNFTGCCVVLAGQCDEVAAAIGNWLMPLISSSFNNIPVVVTLPRTGGSCLVEARSTFQNLAVVDNKANASLFAQFRQPLSYLSAMVSNVKPVESQVIVVGAGNNENNGAPRGRGKNRGGRGGRGRGKRGRYAPY